MEQPNISIGIVISTIGMILGTIGIVTISKAEKEKK